MVWLILGSIVFVAFVVSLVVYLRQRSKPKQPTLVFMNGMLMAEGADQDYVMGVDGLPTFRFAVRTDGGRADIVQILRPDGTRQLVSPHLLRSTVARPDPRSRAVPGIDTTGRLDINVNLPQVRGVDAQQAAQRVVEALRVPDPALSRLRPEERPQPAPAPAPTRFDRDIE